ncbi:p21-C-terminal region-binding protein-domain-containing protein [Ephemerocybe angulata]|uniref:Protein BCP1 n=1 Tax=Ephemerocybe angulata TaxID=980116 RepID=A0A8H6HS11_9AGAR|nr:p21-C-terminal region-binding protein-domain-containing protein [Tulosesus angulatus]
MAKRAAQVSDDEGDSGSDVSLIDVSFDFLSPNPDVDYQAIKRLLGQLLGRDSEGFNLHELTELILSQPNIGSTIKTDGEESDPYALLTVLNMHIHHEHPSIKALARYCLSKASDSPALHSTLQSLFSQSEKHVGLVICERLINMPVQVIPPLYNMLKDEVRNAVAQNLPYQFSHLLFISRTYHLSLDEESQLENTLPASEARKKKGASKKRKSAAHDEANAQHVRPDDGIYSFHPEDAAIIELASHTLNYTYTAPLPETHQEGRDKNAFGLDTRGRIMLLPLTDSPAMDTGEGKDTWDVLAEKLAREYGVPQ